MLDKKILTELSNLGIDLDDQSLPIAKEYSIVKSNNNLDLTTSFEHLLLLLLKEMLFIKKNNTEDFKYYLKRLNSRDISFWGERFEIAMYGTLIHKYLDRNFSIRRGMAPAEPDFVITLDNNLFQLEITSSKFSDDYINSDAIKKIHTLILAKESKSYATTNTCLIIDVTNLVYHRHKYDNFSIPMTEYLENLSTKFGAVFLQFSSHAFENGKAHFFNQAYHYENIKINNELQYFINDFLKGPQTSYETTIKFRH